MMRIQFKTSTSKYCFALCAAALVIGPVAAGLAQSPAAAESESGAAATTDYRPKKYSAGRYRSLYANSAFEREIIPPEQPEAGPPPTPFDMKIVSVTGKGGSYRVVLVDKKGKYQVVTEEPDADGFHYTDIEPSPKIQDFRVKVAKGGQTEWAEFDTKRYSIASKQIAPPKPTNTGNRPVVVPNTRTPPPSRGAPAAATPASPAAQAAAQRSGAAAQAAIEAANAASRGSSGRSTSSRVSGRRVVLPPTSR